MCMVVSSTDTFGPDMVMHVSFQPVIGYCLTSVEATWDGDISNFCSVARYKAAKRFPVRSVTSNSLIAAGYGQALYDCAMI